MYEGKNYPYKIENEKDMSGVFLYLIQKNIFSWINFSKKKKNSL